MKFNTCRNVLEGKILDSVSLMENFIVSISGGGVRRAAWCRVASGAVYVISDVNYAASANILSNRYSVVQLDSIEKPIIPAWVKIRVSTHYVQ